MGLPAIKRDDDGNVEQDCKPLNVDKVFSELQFAIKHKRTFLGKMPGWWLEMIGDTAQAIADEADPYEHDEWGVRFLERS